MATIFSGSMGLFLARSAAQYWESQTDTPMSTKKLAPTKCALIGLPLNAVLSRRSAPA